LNVALALSNFPEDTMKPARKLYIFVTLIGSFCLGWLAHSQPDVVAAQARKPIMMTRIYTGPDGLSHAEEIEMKLNGNVTEMIKATGVEFSRRPPGSTNEWHPGPRRQFVITLSGRGELEVAGGKKVPVGPGHINLIEDTTGKGHITRNLGSEDRIAITIPLADQTAGDPTRR
jgi:quercetin dioxygenase-like cupin family protein